MKRARSVKVPASVIVSSDDEGNVEDSKPAKKPRKSSVKSKVSTARPSQEVKAKRAKTVESVSKAGKKDEVGAGSWTPAEVISRDLHLDLGITQNTVGLLQAGNSVPFIAR